tara:strand:- start:15 stop:926 length:912 start_codon:yes stop_codon:yes gene_type:complete
MSVSDLLNKRLILVSGKGGVGKTLLASCLAYKASLVGKKVCLVQSSAQDQVGPLFGQPPRQHELVNYGLRLNGINLEPELNFRDFIVLHLGFEAIFEKVFTSNIVRSFINMMPGIAELTLLGRLVYYLEQEKEHQFDLVILDGFASGHFLSLLATPDAILEAGLVGPIIQETRRVKALLEDPSRTGFAVVCQPEPLIVSETKEFVGKILEKYPNHLVSLFINRLLPKLPDGESLDHLGSLKERVSQASVRANASAFDLSDYVDSVSSTVNLEGLPDLGVIHEPIDLAEVPKWFEYGQAWSSSI